MFLVASVVFALVFAFFGLGQFLNAETMTGYAAGVIAVFLPATTPPIRDFWAAAEETHIGQIA